MRKDILLFSTIALMLLSVACNNINSNEDGYLEIDKIRIEDNLKELTRTSRMRGTKDELRVSEYIEDEMSSYGFETHIEKFDIYKTEAENFFGDRNFFDLNPENAEPISTGHNVIADLKTGLDKKTLIFSAHYDTKENSKGALDNATGVVSLMEAARLISPESGMLDYNLRIIFFSSEEYFLFGSRSYLNKLGKEEFENILGHVNIDMVGNKRAYNLIAETGGGEDNILTEEFKRVLKNKEVKNYPGASSDGMSFEEKAIPSFKFTTVDYLSNKFDESLIIEQASLDAVSIDKLASTTSIIFDYMKDLDIENIKK